MAAPYVVQTTTGNPARHRGTWTFSGNPIQGLLEFSTAKYEIVLAALARAERLPNDGFRSEEAQTLKIVGNHKEEDWTAIFYQCPEDHANLRDIITTMTKPPPKDRKKLALLTANKVRSIYVHFRVSHSALRTESFVFLGSPSDFERLVILDWGRHSTPSMHQHPAHKPDKPAWFDDFWSLLMVLSEIADWKTLEHTFSDEKQLKESQLQRRTEVTSSFWKGSLTAKVFSYGFSAIDADRQTLENYDYWKIKEIYDQFCAILADQV